MNLYKRIALYITILALGFDVGLFFPKTRLPLPPYIDAEIGIIIAVILVITIVILCGIDRIKP